MRTIVTSCKKSNEKLFQLFPPLRQNLWALGKGVSNINLGIYSQLWPAAPRGFRQFSPGGAGQPVFPWGGVGRGEHPWYLDTNEKFVVSLNDNRLIGKSLIVGHGGCLGCLLGSWGGPWWNRRIFGRLLAIKVALGS